MLSICTNPQQMFMHVATEHTEQAAVFETLWTHGLDHIIIFLLDRKMEGTK